MGVIWWVIGVVYFVLFIIFFKDDIDFSAYTSSSSIQGETKKVQAVEIGTTPKP